LEEEPGLQDDKVLQRAYVERRILITEDKDFGE
jgi:predicted nuclease of predicted toxin-antitoxin system